MQVRTRIPLSFNPATCTREFGNRTAHGGAGKFAMVPWLKQLRIGKLAIERRLAAILVAEVANYARLMEQIEEAFLVVLRSYFGAVREVIAGHRGHIFSGACDGIVAEFPSIVEPIRSALEIQSEIMDRNAVPEPQRVPRS
ncbi:MAG TPA: hypothetical protein VFG64_12705 [Dongiaceae bacterium]|nr:hypothetical protein [Dongiaceae bacterium]